MNKFSAEFVLHLMIAAFGAGIVLVAGAGWQGTRQVHEGNAAALQAGQDLGLALGMARAADAQARVPGADLAALRRQLDPVRQLLGRHQLEAPSLASAAGGAEGWRDVAPEVERLAQQHAARLQAASAGQMATTGWLLLALVLAGTAVVWLLRNWIRRANVGPLRMALHLVQRIAAGDLTANAEGLDQAHTRRLAQALDGMTANLRALAAEVTRSARTVADTSAQIAQGNLDLSQRTEEQASTLEETASSMEQLTSTVAQNADNARQASELAVAASDVARKGGQVVGQVVSTMTEISQSSRKIEDIIGVIDGIAFQTNILALNAAVEAARAGEQGRGFAVVAAEVRSLAQRSAAAAKEIKGLIADSAGKVEAGTKLVDNAGKTMGEIVASVNKVSTLIAEIAAASQEQSSGIGQVNTAVAQMEQVVQQNASLVEEASAATESMKDQAAALLMAVSRFQIGEDADVLPLQPAMPAPIAVRSAPTAALPPAYAMAGGGRKSRQAAGEWEEF